jgi:ABC-type transporter Mla subunit MlaD
MTDESISLREYVDTRFHDQEKAVLTALTAQKEAVSSALAAADRAVAKAETASEKRFESVNEFRGSLADSARLLMPRSEVEQIVKSLEGKIGGLQKMVWVGLGIVLSFQFFLGIVMVFVKGKSV